MDISKNVKEVIPRFLAHVMYMAILSKTELQEFI